MNNYRKVGTGTLDPAAVIATHALPEGWTIQALIERTFRDRCRYTLVAVREGEVMRRWPGIYDVEHALYHVVGWIEGWTEEQAS
jgi:hypothetical protein